MTTPSLAGMLRGQGPRISYPARRPFFFVSGQTTERAWQSVEDLAHSFGFHAAVFLRCDDRRIHVSQGVTTRSETVAPASTWESWRQL